MARALAELTAFIADMKSPAQRPKLWIGIWSGYGLALGFGVLALVVSALDLTPWRWAYAILVGIKLATNTLALLGLVTDRRVLATQVLNTLADVAALTAAIYFTGGATSPLIATYVILVTVLGLLSNLGVTLLVAGVIVVAFTTMAVLIAVGVLPPTSVPGGAQPSAQLTIVATLYCALVVGVPAWFAAASLRQLRAKELALEARTAQLIRTATQRSQFVASMTHELRTPIHGVQGLADVIAAGVYGPITDKQRTALASIKHSAQGLLSLVDDLLNLTRAEAGKIEARPAPVDVAKLVEHVADSVSWIVGTKKLELEVDVAPDLPEVASDERWLAHVLVNLLANAVKFTPEGGHVTIRARELEPGEGVPHGAVAISVIDTGIGIAPADKAAIFEPFRQVEHGDDKGYGGVGLGLALVARLVDLIGARVELDSAVGKGSTFRVIVPLAWGGRGSTQMLRAVKPPD